MVYDGLLFSDVPSTSQPPPPTAQCTGLNITRNDFDLIVNGEVPNHLSTEDTKLLNEWRGKLIAPFLLNDTRIGECYKRPDTSRSNRYGFVLHSGVRGTAFGNCEFGLLRNTSTFQLNAHAHHVHKNIIRAGEFDRSDDFALAWITNKNRILFAYYTHCNCGSFIERRQSHRNSDCTASVDHGWQLSQMNVTEWKESLNTYRELNGFVKKYLTNEYVGQFNTT